MSIPGRYAFKCEDAGGPDAGQAMPICGGCTWTLGGDAQKHCAVELWEVHKPLELVAQNHVGCFSHASNPTRHWHIWFFGYGIECPSHLVFPLSVPMGQQCQHLTNWNLFTKNLSSKMSTYCVMPLQLNWGTHWPTSFRIIRSGFLWLSIAMGLLVCAWQCVRGAIPYHFWYLLYFVKMASDGVTRCKKTSKMVWDCLP